MASNTIPKIDSGGGGTVLASDASQADTIARRDSSQDIYTNIFRGATGLRSGGHFYALTVARSADTTIDETTYNGTTYNITTAASAITITLPAASGVTGKIIAIKKADTGAGTVVIDGNASETIEGKTTFTLYTFGDVVWIQCDGSNWNILDAAISPVVIAKSADFTAADQPLTEFVYIVTTGGAVTATLPAVSGLKGRKYTFKRVSASNNLIIDGSGAETIDGAATKTNAVQYSHYAIITDGSAWHMVASSGTWT